MKTISQDYTLVAIIVVWVILLLSAVEAKAANECQIKYFYTIGLAKNERGRWATIRGSAGQSVPVRGRLYLKEIQNTGKHDVNAFLVKQRPPIYLRPREKRNTSRMGSAAVLTRVQCLTTIAGRPQRPLTSKSSPAQVKSVPAQVQRSTMRPASPATRQSSAVIQKPVTTTSRDRVPVQRRPPPLQSNDPNYQQYNDTFSSKPRPSVASAGSGSGQQAGSQSPEDPVTAEAFDYFECGTSNHRAVSAYLLAMASHAIYPVVSSGSDNEDGNWSKFKGRFENQFKDLGMDTVQLINGGASGAEVAVMSNDGCIIVVYRGSQSPSTLEGVLDWMVDLNITPFPPPFALNSQAQPPSWWKSGVVVSNGNYLALQSVYTTVRNAINEQQNQSNSKKLFITGHSLGGALAVLTAYQLKKASGIGTRAVYTFGGPKVGNVNFENDYNSLGISTYRWSFGLDPVSLLPPGLADQPAWAEVGSKLGMLGGIPFPPVPQAFQHVGTRVGPQGDFGAGCVHSIVVYGDGVRRTLASSQRSQLPASWLENPSVQVVGCML